LKWERAEVGSDAYGIILGRKRKSARGRTSRHLGAKSCQPATWVGAHGLREKNKTPDEEKAAGLGGYPLC